VPSYSFAESALVAKSSDVASQLPLAEAAKLGREAGRLLGREGLKKFRMPHTVQ